MKLSDALDYDVVKKLYMINLLKKLTQLVLVKQVKKQTKYQKIKKLRKKLAIFDERLKQANLVTKDDIADFIEKYIL